MNVSALGFGYKKQRFAKVLASMIVRMMIGCEVLFEALAVDNSQQALGQLSIKSTEAVPVEENTLETESVETVADSELYALAASLMDADSGRILYEKNGDEQLAMASTTKIMTCIIALEYGNMEAICEVSSYAASMPEVKLGLRTGEQYRLGDLLYAMMLESDNDAAVVVAEAVAGSVEDFALLMNEKAKSLGAENTCFVTPNGLDAEGHKSTAIDLAKIAGYAIQNETFVKITNTAAHSFTDIERKRQFSVYNHDGFLTQMEGAFGIKTGYTGQAGYCFVGALERDGKTLISVVLGSGWPPNKSYKWADTKKLMNYGLDNYEYQTLFEPDAHVKSVTVIDGVEDSVDTYVNGSYGALVSEQDEIEVVYDVADTLTAPVYANTKVGEVQVMINGECMAEYPVLTYEGVEEIDFIWCLEYVLEKFFSAGKYSIYSANQSMAR